ncbi:hypothetical protein HCUR_00092 [Holospora curviuscula]|uniref:Uncharacterized protein n=1 Tax=Holospora curviuscula TaxID=1082868 RepID=A0A2S5RHT0_9PROT|nr:hypothetical protein HCUR_00092 [Holospora curviuscula]
MIKKIRIARPINVHGDSKFIIPAMLWVCLKYVPRFLPSSFFTFLTQCSIFENSPVYTTLITLYKTFRCYIVDCVLIVISLEVFPGVKIFYR